VIMPEALLILPRLRIQNANAISSALTWGFPSPSAFLGFVHALHRRMADEFDVALEGCAIVCHGVQPLVSKPAGKRTNVFNLTRNPVGKDGSSAALVEEGRIHLEISLVIGLGGDGLYGGDDKQSIADRAYELAMTMRCAGGSVLPAAGRLAPRRGPTIILWPDEDDAEEIVKTTREIRQKVMPGFALVSREMLVSDHWNELRKNVPDCTAIDALLDLSRLNIDPVTTADIDDRTGETTNWVVRRKPGWIVPIPAGFAAISDLYDPGVVKNTRDDQTPFRFVEGVLTAGQWLSPHRVQDIRHLLWCCVVDQDAGLYRCTTPYYANISEENLQDA
jgi:CRISPR-associated protein Csy2